MYKRKKKQLGWIKATEVAQKALSSNPQYTVYEKPFNTSFKLGENLELRECQKWFFKDVFQHFDNGGERIKQGWSGLESQTINLIKDRNKSFRKVYDQTPSQSLKKSRYSPVVYKQAPHPLDEKTSWRSTNINDRKMNGLNTLDAKPAASKITTQLIKPWNKPIQKKL